MFTTEDKLEAAFSLESERGGVIEEIPFNVLFIGKWTPTDETALSGRVPIEIDRDNFDDVMRRMGVSLQLGDSSYSFTSIDDFHPDTLLARLPVFAELRKLRAELKDERSYRRAAAEICAREGSNERVIERPESSGQPQAASLLDAILDKPQGGGSPSEMPVAKELKELIREAVGPHLVSIDAEEQASVINAVDEAISEQMRSILNGREFRELEAAWRALFLAVRRIETSSTLKLFILNAGKEEVATELAEASDVSGTSFANVVSGGIGGYAWSLICGNFTFEPNVGDVAAAIRIAQICETARVPFISHMRPSMFELRPEGGVVVNADSAEMRLWNALREMPETENVGMVMPRFLVREVYGAESDPTETFAFEEVVGEPNYLFSNGAFLAAILLAQHFSENSDDGSAIAAEIDRLPTHTFTMSGETRMQAPAEIQLSEHDVITLTENGMMPIVSFKNSDRVRVVRFQSVSASDKPLRGRWTRR